VAIAALLLWLCTAAIGSYLLVTAIHSGKNAPAPVPAEPVPVAAEQPVAAVRRVRDKDRFDPPSLQRAKNEPLPGIGALAEFAHPALAIIGIGFWLGYVVSRDRLFAAIGLGILLGAICAGLSWFAANTRAARRAAAAAAAGGSGTGNPGTPPLSPAPRLLILHAVGAALTLLFAAWIAVRA
jgi:hypothetical protein